MSYVQNSDIINVLFLQATDALCASFCMHEAFSQCKS